MSLLDDDVAAFDFGAGGDEHDLIAQRGAGVREGLDAERETRGKALLDRGSRDPQLLGEGFCGPSALGEQLGDHG